MKMIKLQKIGLRSAAGVFASLSLFGGATAQAVDDTPWTTPAVVPDASTFSTVPTNLWCAWFVTGMSSTVSLYPIAGLTKSVDPLTLTPTEYNGQALTLTGFSLDNEALVAGYDQLNPSPTVDDRKGADGVLLETDPFDCSWYNAQLGFTSTVSVVPGTTEAPSNSQFVATYNGGITDLNMDFGLTNATPSDGIAVTFEAEDADCDTTAAGFNLQTMTIETPADTALVAQVAYAPDLGTDLSCKWDTKFVVVMPANLTPASPGSDYLFTGPTLKTTIGLMVPAP